MIAAALILLTALSAIAQDHLVMTEIPLHDVALRNSRAMEIGLSGTLYVVDFAQSRLLALDSTGKVVQQSGESGSSSDLRWPKDVAVASGGRVLVADAGHRRIVEYSRLMEWKGELRIAGNDGESLEPKELCATSRGDLIVYESDQGQMLRYDPFYGLSGKLGMNSGQDFSLSVESLCFSEQFGVMWIGDQDGTIFHSDQLLNEARPWPLAPAPTGFSELTAVDSVVFATNNAFLWRVSPSNADSASVFCESGDAVRFEDLLLAAQSPHRLYLLNRKNGALFRLDWP
ncbi:MAG: hypothetical protein H6506_03405 [Calditrichaeota bacterium]|nr:hypothetical protein [Calditrichota bacterium]MCB9366248.1 hypothetical protein [Calditrichota bacterium]MCB9391683.1 hypothetical protein [Calditrichota bacterium]